MAGTVIASTAALVGSEGLKKSEPFAAIASAVTSGINKVPEADLTEAVTAPTGKFKAQLRLFMSSEAILNRLTTRNDALLKGRTARLADLAVVCAKLPSNDSPRSSVQAVSRPDTCHDVIAHCRHKFLSA